MADQDRPYIGDILKDAPKNWGKWGDDDEVGALNYLGPEQVLAGITYIRSGKVFTLQLPIGRPGGDPVWPGRRPAERYMLLDESDYVAGNGPTVPGGFHFADDAISMSLQGSTQYDALGHVWFDGQMWNGYPAESTYGGMSRAGVYPIGQKGVVGRGVLLDVARFRGKDALDKGERIGLDDLLACAEEQGTTLRKRDILLLRTGFLETFERDGAAVFYEGFDEPGLTYSPELVAWFDEMEIPNLATDTMGNELTSNPDLGVNMSLHSALMRNLGITFTEICDLAELAADCADDRQYDFLYAAAPLKIIAATGGPVNPIVVK